jgi:hypothetical protein
VLPHLPVGDTATLTHITVCALPVARRDLEIDRARTAVTCRNVACIISGRKKSARYLLHVRIMPAMGDKAMFILDDVVGEAVSYFFKRVESSRELHDEAIGQIKVAMRGLSASFGEIIAFYQKAGHKLKRFQAAGDTDGFWHYLSQMLDENRLRRFCNASGVCQELRVAQDKLFELPIAAESREKRLIAELARQLEAYEMGMIYAIKEYFQKAEAIDLLAAAGSRDVEPEEVQAALDKCLAGLNRHKDKVDSVLQLIRERSIQASI